MKELYELLKYILPAIPVLIGVYLTYWYGLRRFEHEEKNKEVKRIREIVSNLLLIWDEFTFIKLFLESKNFTNRIILIIPELAKEHLEIDKEAIDKLQESYSDAIEQIKEINVILYFKMENALHPFTTVIEDILNPIINDDGVSVNDKKEILIPLISENIDELTQIINSIITRLPKKEQREIEQLMNNHAIELNNKASAFPPSLLDLFNNTLPLIEPITKEEFEILIKNETLTWLIEKVFTTPLIKIIDFKNPSDILKTLSMLKQKELKDLEEKYKGINPAEIILSLNITEEEEKNNLQDNDTFYKVVLASARKFIDEIPFQFKRSLLCINNGKYSIREALEKEKQKLLSHIEVSTVEIYVDENEQQDESEDENKD